MTPSTRRLSLLLIGAALLLTSADALYTMSQDQQAVVLRFGAPVRVINATATGAAAGLYAKWPFVERVVRLDRRLLTLQGEPQALITRDADPLSVQAQLSYRIVDPLRFYRASNDGRDGAELLQRVLDTSVAHALSAASWRDAVAKRRAALMQNALADARRAAAADQLGVELTDVHLVQLDPPPAQAEATARRMQEVESQQATAIRARGDANRRELIAAADREAGEIRAQGEEQALEVRGQGDAQRADILGAAYGADPAFARFFRRLEAYDQALNPANTTLVLSSDNAFLDLFSHGPEAARSPRR